MKKLEIQTDELTKVRFSLGEKFLNISQYRKRLKLFSGDEPIEKLEELISIPIDKICYILEWLKGSPNE